MSYIWFLILKTNQTKLNGGPAPRRILKTVLGETREEEA